MDFSIKDAARTVGLTPRILRYYENIGLLPEAERTSGNYRLFNVMDVISLIRVKRLTGLGLDSRHVCQIMDGPTSPEATATLGTQWQVLTQQINELREKRTKIEEIQSAQTPLDIATGSADLECAWADVQSGLDVKDRSKLEIELLAALADDSDQLKYEKLTRTFIEKHDDPGFRGLQELDIRLEVFEPNASPGEVAILVDDHARALSPIHARFASTGEKALTLASAMEEFIYNEAQLIVITNAWKCLQSSDGENPDPS